MALGLLLFLVLSASADAEDAPGTVLPSTRVHVEIVDQELDPDEQVSARVCLDRRRTPPRVRFRAG